MQQPKKAKILHKHNLINLALQGSNQGIPTEDWKSVEETRKKVVNNRNYHIYIFLHSDVRDRQRQDLFSFTL
jgi:hypothetical protein